MILTIQYIVYATFAMLFSTMLFVAKKRKTEKQFATLVTTKRRTNNV